MTDDDDDDEESSGMDVFRGTHKCHRTTKVSYTTFLSFNFLQTYLSIY